MIEWFDPKEKLPDDEQECLLMPVDRGACLTVWVYGPIAWSAKQRCWLDLFRDPEAGSIVRPEVVGKWTPWEPIAPQEGRMSLTDDERAIRDQKIVERRDAGATYRSLGRDFALSHNRVRDIYMKACRRRAYLAGRNEQARSNP